MCKVNDDDDIIWWETLWFIISLIQYIHLVKDPVYIFSLSSDSVRYYMCLWYRYSHMFTYLVNIAHNGKILTVLSFSIKSKTCTILHKPEKYHYHSNGVHYIWHVQSLLFHCALCIKVSSRVSSTNDRRFHLTCLMPKCTFVACFFPTENKSAILKDLFTNTAGPHTKESYIKHDFIRRSGIK